MMYRRLMKDVALAHGINNLRGEVFRDESGGTWITKGSPSKTFSSSRFRFRDTDAIVVMSAAPRFQPVASGYSGIY